VIVALGIHGSGLAPLPLASDRRTFTVGAGACDLVVPGAEPVHAIVERVGAALRVTAVGDLPLYRSPWTASVREVLLYAGAVAWLGEAPLLALDANMMSLRPRLAWSMGLDAAGPVDTALVAAADRAPLLILGPRNLDDDAILAALDGAAACIDLDEPRALPAPQAARVFAPRRDARIVLRATKANHARSVLDTYADRVSVVRLAPLAPLATRPTEIERLLAAMWRDLGTTARVDALGSRALRALASYRWPGNLTELRAHAPRILAYHQRGGLRAAARALGIAHQTLAQHFNRIGFPVLDQADREAADRDSDPLTAEYLIWVLWRAKPRNRNRDRDRRP